MKLKCTIGSQGFVGGPTYKDGEEYELEDEEQAKQIIKWGYAEEVKEVTPSASHPSSIVRNNTQKEESVRVKENPLRKTRARKKY